MRIKFRRRISGFLIQARLLKFYERKSDADLIDAAFVVREAFAVAIEVAQIAVKSAIKDREAVV